MEIQEWTYTINIMFSSTSTPVNQSQHIYFSVTCDNPHFKSNILFDWLKIIINRTSCYN